MADIATWNEFGTKATSKHPGIPARSFMRSTFDEKLRTYERFIQKNLGKVGGSMVRTGQGGITAEMFLNLLGEKIRADVQRKIVKLKDPPNQPSTIRKKKSSNPLIDTGRLRQSIDFEVK
jgi:hypothetical protein